MTNQHPRFIIMTASEKMPLTCWGRYRHVAVVELHPDFQGTPKMISERARGVRRIVSDRRRLFDGKTGRCAYQAALREATAEAAALNAE